MEDEIALVHAQISISSTASPEASTSPSASEDAIALFRPSSLDRKIDTVVMNPPFGSWTKGIDMIFLEVACEVRRSLKSRSSSLIASLRQIAETAVYSLHKTSTRDFILRKAKTLGFEGEVLAEMRVRRFSLLFPYRC